MFYFRDLVSSSSESRYLIISDHKNSKVETKLPVDTPLSGQYAAPWPSLENLPGLDNWTLEHNSRPPKTWVLRTYNHQSKNIASSLPCLGRRIIKKETRWNDTVTFDGEIHFIPGYWEWAEDILSRSRQDLKGARIYDAVYDSLFTYDRNTSILQAFCEAWCPVTNTLLTSVGELSISLWDLYVIGGLPITGSLYEEVVPNVAELTGTCDQGKRFLPQSCEHLLDAFHQIRVKNNGDPNVSVEKWIEFWCKKNTYYKHPPPRKEKKSSCLKLSHNPTGVIDEFDNWSPAEEAVFRKLEIKSHKINETYLAAFLSCWLCVFVLPKEGGFIRPGVFRNACHLASGRRISLAIPVLANIYRGLNTISECSRLDLVRTCFPIHYVYGWLAYYFKTHYPLAGGPADPLMATFSGEGAARYFGGEDARKRIHGGGTIAWDATLLDRIHAYHYRDDGTEQDYSTNLFMSLRANYLPFRDENVFIVEPYSPHRFSRQFGYLQDTPGRLDKDIREASLEDGLRLARICVLSKSWARATFPPNGSNMKKLFSPNYKSWWEKVHGRFLENHMQFLANAVGANTETFQEHDDEVLIVDQPSISKSKIVPEKIKGPLHKEVQKEKCPTQIHQTSHKRPSQDEVNGTDNGRCGKKVKSLLYTPKDTNLHATEVSDNNVSSSRTMTAIKELDNASLYEVSNERKPEDSSESVEGSNSRKSFSMDKGEEETTSVSHGKTPIIGKSDHHKQPAISVSVLNGRKVVSDLRKSLAKEAWIRIRSKLIDLSVDQASTLKDEVQVILDDVILAGVDISPLKKLLLSFFELADSYDQARSSLADIDVELENSESYLRAKENLNLVLNEKNQKDEELSAARQVLKEARKKVKELKAIRDIAKKEVEDVEPKVLAAEQEYNQCADISSATASASSDVEEKKMALEVALQELADYNLCLD